PQSAQSAYHAAIERFEQLVAKEPESVDYHRQLADSYHGMSQTISKWEDAKPWLERSENSLSKAIQLPPAVASLYARRREIYPDDIPLWLEPGEARQRVDEVVFPGPRQNGPQV